LIQKIGSFTKEIIDAAGSAGSDKGSGGMITKLEAARLLMAANIPMVICEGHKPDAIVNAASGKPVGTIFHSDNTGKQVGARKLWTALSGNVKGSVTVDGGAVKALTEKGSSLLPIGVKSVNGTFEQGNVIDIRSDEGLLVGRGLSAYSSADLKLAAGQHSDTLVSSSLFANQNKLEVIHRDQMVVF
jgi:glutamate 5-kinase